MRAITRISMYIILNRLKHTIFLRLTAQTQKMCTPFFMKKFGRGKPADIIFWSSEPPQSPIPKFPYLYKWDRDGIFTARGCILIYFQVIKVLVSRRCAMAQASNQTWRNKRQKHSSWVAVMQKIANPPFSKFSPNLLPAPALKQRNMVIQSNC